GREKHEGEAPIERVAPTVRIIFKTPEGNPFPLGVGGHELASQLLNNLAQRSGWNTCARQHSYQLASVDSDDQGRVVKLLAGFVPLKPKAGDRGQTLDV